MNINTKVLLLLLSTAGKLVLAQSRTDGTMATHDGSRIISSQGGNTKMKRRILRSTSAQIGRRTPPSFQSRQQDIDHVVGKRNLIENEENRTEDTNRELDIQEATFWESYLATIESMLTPKPVATPGPSAGPTTSPTFVPTRTPTLAPNLTDPTPVPTSAPQAPLTSPPTAAPTLAPQPDPTAAPTAEPTSPPTVAPTASPTSTPTLTPTSTPTSPPTSTPTSPPTSTPTSPPTLNPTSPPTLNPTVPPTAAPITPSPTVPPTAIPTPPPTANPTPAPTANPTPAPTPVLTPAPTEDRCATSSTITEIICAAPNFSITCNLLQQTGLDVVLDDPTVDLTIFPPSDVGWDIASDVLAIQTLAPNQLEFLLLYHVTEGRVLEADLVNNGLLPMLNGLNSLTFQILSSTGTLATFQFGDGNSNTNAGLLQDTDIIACNGVLHSINGVILPTDNQYPPPGPLPSTPPPVPAPTVAPVVPPTETPVVPPTEVPVLSPTEAPLPVPTQSSVVRQAILPVALQGGAEFDDPNSCQSQALIRTEDVQGIDILSENKIIQYYALYCIYTCTNAVSNAITEAEGLVSVPEWIVATGWDTNNTDSCTWFGISCSNDQVTDIDLFSNALTGAFPAEVTLLAADGPRSTGAGALARLDLFDNMLLTNNGDNSWWSFLGSQLTFFFFKDTAFSGPLGRLPDNIQEFDCSFSFISGGLTDENFAGLNQLQFADFDGNAYNTSVPQAFTNLQRLEFLYMVDGFISGDLSYMIGMPAIREHWIDTNPGLGGTIPTELSTLTTLESLSITSCSFSGNIPTEFGNFGGVMRQIWMYDNALTGQIPTELGLLSGLTRLQLEGNAFTGSMPDEVCANTFPPLPLEILGADCFDENFSCDCCTCCSVLECPV